MTTTPELTTSLSYVLFLFVPTLLDFRFIFQSEPRVLSFQMGFGILSVVVVVSLLVQLNPRA